jgi:prephenate dehydrogenase
MSLGSKTTIWSLSPATRYSPENRNHVVRRNRHSSPTRNARPKEVAKSLLETGIELVDWKPEGHDECWDITQALYYKDGSKHVEQLIADGGEESKNVKYRTVEEIWDVCLIFLSPFLV